VAVAVSRVGLIHNPKSHRNRRRGMVDPPSGVLVNAPVTPRELVPVLKDFAARGIDLIVIDGGDGTVREVVSRLSEAYGGKPPRLAVLPTGKTNALALDLGAHPGWSLESALAAACRGETKTRRPIEILRNGAETPEKRGFVFGAGVFVRATRMAARPHRLGLIDSVGVAFTLLGAAGAALAGGWRKGEAMEIDGREARLFLLMASSLKRMPLGIKPFGEPRDGLKRLTVQAPPRALALALPQILKGGDCAWLEPAGYRRDDVEAFRMAWTGEYVLDGEVYAGGDVVVRLGQPLEFVAP
jgi:diacylglycerol kinase (ATP)